MAKIISMVNQKGGVGKTTTSINLSSCLAQLGSKVLLIDIDPQGNCTTGLGINKSDIKNSVYELMTDNASIKDSITKTKYKRLSIIPASINLAGIDSELIEKGYAEEGFKKVEQLKKHCDSVKENYDYIIIDCPPSLGILTSNALAASDSVMIPVQCEFFALEGILQLLNTITLAQRSINPGLQIEGVLLTMYDSRTNLGAEVVENIRSYFKEKVYDTIIPRLVRLSEAPSYGKPINFYDSESKGCTAYTNLAKEVLQRNG